MNLQTFPLLCCLSGLLYSCSAPPVKPKHVTVEGNRAVRPTSPRVLKDPSLVERAVHQKINEHRASIGKSLLTDNIFLDNLARQHSEYMRRTAEAKGQLTLISHDGFDSRFKAATSNGQFRGLAENVAVSQGVAGEYVTEIFVSGWIKSPGHYKNIRGDYQYSGVGVVIGKNNTVYATQLFAR